MAYNDKIFIPSLDENKSAGSEVIIVGKQRADD
jgi:hypothetical protein